MLGELVKRITYGGVVIIMRLYSLGQCQEINFGHRLKLVILLCFKSFCPTMACTIPIKITYMFVDILLGLVCNKLVNCYARFIFLICLYLSKVCEKSTGDIGAFRMTQRHKNICHFKVNNCFFTLI